MKIKAAVLDKMGAAHPYADSKPLSIETVELAPPGRGEVLIKVVAAGAVAYDAAYSGETHVQVDKIAAPPLDERKLIARRCAFELPPGGVINLGIGMPEVLGAVAAEERVLDHLTLTAEPGVIGGMPQGGLDFGAAVNTQVLLHQNQQFDFYEVAGSTWPAGHGADRPRRQLNVSRFGPRLAGSGGFVNISQNARQLVFAGTFTTGGLKVAVEDGRIRIVSQGTMPKFVDAVEQITFSGPRAVATRQPVPATEKRRADRALDLPESADCDPDRRLLGVVANGSVRLPHQLPERGALRDAFGRPGRQVSRRPRGQVDKRAAMRLACHAPGVDPRQAPMPIIVDQAQRTHCGVAFAVHQPVWPEAEHEQRLKPRLPARAAPAQCGRGARASVAPRRSGDVVARLGAAVRPTHRAAHARIDFADGGHAPKP